MSRFKQWLKSERGASMVEYALLVVLISLVALTALTMMGQEVSGLYSEIDSGLLGAKP